MYLQHRNDELKRNVLLFHEAIKKYQTQRLTVN